MKIRKVGVLGAGLMGSGIAEVAAKSGYETVVREVSDELGRKGIARIEASLGRAVEKRIGEGGEQLHQIRLPIRSGLGV